MPCRQPLCPFCDPVGAIQAYEEATKHSDGWPVHHDPDEPLYGDVKAYLAGDTPPPPTPLLLRRLDGHRMFYAGKVNVIFGDPECGKTWIALAAIVEALDAGRKAVFVDLDHNGMPEIIGRLLLLGAKPSDLGDLEKFRYAEPEDGDMLIVTVADLKRWRPAVAVVDSLGELIPMLGGSSNSPDDYTSAHRRVLSALSVAGAAVIGIDHLPKDDGAREKGQTGTVAKRRSVNGVTYRVTTAAVFTPGRGGAANMTITKDRPGGVRQHCPPGKTQPAGRFVMVQQPDGGLRWFVTDPRSVATAEVLVPDDDIAAIDGLSPPPSGQRDVMKRLRWGAHRAMNALRKWRDMQGLEGLDSTD